MVIISETNKMLTVKEVADYLHVHINTVRKWSDEGILKSYRIGPRQDRRFNSKDIEYFINFGPPAPIAIDDNIISNRPKPRSMMSIINF
jgi:excisionase family DNA binding protein